MDQVKHALQYNVMQDKLNFIYYRMRQVESSVSFGQMRSSLSKYIFVDAVKDNKTSLILLAYNAINFLIFSRACVHRQPSFC